MQSELDPRTTSPRIKYVIAPERSHGVSAPTPEPTTAPEKKSRRGLLIGITTGLAGAALAAGAIMGIGSMSEAPRPGPVAEAPVEPTSEPSPVTPDKNEALPSEQELEIPAGLSAEEVGALLIDRYDAWSNAGSNNQMINDGSLTALGENISMGEYTTGLAEEYAQVFAEALYVDGWQDDTQHPGLAGDYDFQVTRNAFNLELNLKTSDPANGDIEPFYNSFTTDAAREISSDGDTRVIEVDSTESNNSDSNRVGEAFGQEIPEIEQGEDTYTFTLVTVDGTERISALAIRGR